MKKLATALMFALPFTLAACTASETEVRTSHEQPITAADDDAADEDGDDESEVLVAAAEIPAVVRGAALARVPGLSIELAEKELEDGRVVYCVHGTADGTFYEVEVTADGTVLEVETGADDDE